MYSLTARRIQITQHTVPNNSAEPQVLRPFGI